MHLSGKCNERPDMKKEPRPYMIVGTNIHGFENLSLISKIRKIRGMEEKDYSEGFVKWFSKFLAGYYAPLSLEEDYNWLWRKMMIERHGRENVKFHDEM